MKAPTALTSVLEALAETWKEQITFSFVFKLDLFKNNRHKTSSPQTRFLKGDVIDAARKPSFI